VALSFLSATSGYGFSAPGPSGTPSVAQMTFDGGTVGVAAPTKADTAATYGVPVPPICGWQVQARVSVVQGP
jgi:hypothetical protein